MDLPVFQVLDALAAGVLDAQPSDVCIRDDGEIGPAGDRDKVAIGRALPRPVDDVALVP